MNHFLITDHNRDGEHEYYDLVLVSTVMSEAEMRSDHNSWKKAFLDWQFYDTYEDEDDHTWSNNRVVSIYEVKNVPKEDAPVLERYLGTFDLDKIIEEYYEETV